MSNEKSQTHLSRLNAHKRPVSLKQLAKHLDLSPTTVSLVLNRAPEAGVIPDGTKRRIFEAARGFNYRPNFLARSLRSRRSYTVGVLVPELSNGYPAALLCGVEEFLITQGYFYIVASHRHNPELIEKYPQMLFDRCVEGLIAIDTPCAGDVQLPTIAIPGHQAVPGVTNVVLDHHRAAQLALTHLTELGHRDIAFIRGQAFSSDSVVRWEAIQEAAAGMGLSIDPELVVQLESLSPWPEVGSAAARQLLATGRPFTALFSWNDVSAIGAIQALREAGYRVPSDISVVGFDDIPAAQYHNPALTTIRQPLFDMGRIAAETLLRRIATAETGPAEIEMAPELVLRESTAPAQSSARL